MICTTDFHTHILDLFQKPNLQVWYMYSQNNYFLVNIEITNILENVEHDSIRYCNNTWYGVSKNQERRKVAYFDRPELQNITIRKFMELVDFQYHVLKTSHGNHINTYQEIFITSQYPIKELMPNIPPLYLERLLKWIKIIEY